MKWKLQRGKWRPRLQALVDELPSDAVVEASTAAFAALAEESAEAEAALRAAVNALTVLKVTPPIMRPELRQPWLCADACREQV